MAQKSFLESLLEQNPLNPLNKFQQPQLQQQTSDTGIGSLLQNLAQNKVEKVAQRNGMGAIQDKRNELQPYQQALQEILNKPGGGEEFQIPQQAKEKEATDLAKLSLQERRDKANREFKEQQEINKLTQPFFKEVGEKADAAKAADKRLDRMKVLISNGNLPTPGFYSILSGLDEFGKGTPIVGGILNSIAKPFQILLRTTQDGATLRDLEEFEKLSNDFVREAKSIYGSRLTNADLANFMKLIPTLSQSNPGKLAVIRNLENIYKADIVKNKALKQILRENNGKRPSDLRFQVEKRAKKKLDQLAKKFSAGESIKGDPKVETKEEFIKRNESV